MVKKVPQDNMIFFDNCALVLNKFILAGELLFCKLPLQCLKQNESKPGKN